jgi:uncharacterized protein (TIGR00369 family)
MSFDFPRDAEGAIDARAFFDGFWRRMRLHDHIGLELVEADVKAGTAVLRLPYRPEHTNMPDEAGAGIHGGMIATLIDAAASFPVVVHTGNFNIATVNMRVDYLSWTGHATLLGHGRVVKAGRTVAVADCDIRDEKGKLCAIGRVTFGTGTAYKAVPTGV